MLAVQESPAETSFDADAEASRGEQELAQASTRTVRVTYQDGLHLRPCSTIVSTVDRYRAKVTVQKGTQSSDAASIFGLLSLAATYGTELVLTATGVDAQDALDAVAVLFAADFQRCC